jgi:hypothetical protein
VSTEGDDAPGDEPPTRRATLGAVAIVTAVAVLSTLVALLARGDDPEPVRRVAAAPPTSVIVDSFGRPNRVGLGPAETGGRWASVSGSWTTAAGKARLQKPAAKGPNIAVVDVQAPNGLVQATVGHVGAGSGIVFRYANPFNHWALVAAPRFATWSLQRVIDGERTAVRRIGPASTADGTSILIRNGSDTIEVIIDGRLVATVRDRNLNDATRSGLFVAEGVTDASFDAFTATPLRPGA